MKKIVVVLFLVSSFLGYAQQTKKKIYKKPIKKMYVKKKTIAKPESKDLFKNEESGISALVEVNPAQEEKKILVQETIKPETVATTKQDFEITAEKIQNKKGWINNRNSNLVRGVEGFVKGVYSGNGKIFVLIEVMNRSNINYDIQNISFITSPSKKKNKGIDTEEKLFIPIWSSQPETIAKKNTQKMVFVFDKFTIAENKTLNAIINENEGERNLKLEIKPTYILGAEYIN